MTEKQIIAKLKNLIKRCRGMTTGYICNPYYDKAQSEYELICEEYDLTNRIDLPFWLYDLANSYTYESTVCEINTGVIFQS